MTLCIAAHADELIGRKIVLCHDAQMGDDYSTSEMAHKLATPLAGNVVVLWSGAIDHVTELLQVYRDRSTGSNELRLTDFKEELWMGFKQFLEALKRRGQKRTDVQFIVAGFIEKVPKIISVDSSGVFEHPNFYAIGTGAPHADTILRFRDCVKQAPLDMVLYFVYEAKKFGELSPHVGKHTEMEILELTRNTYNIRFVYPAMDTLRQYYEAFKLRDFNPPKYGLPPLFPGPAG